MTSRRMIMSDRLITVATFWDPIEANLVRNRLEAAGVRTFLASEESVNMAWYLTNAVGGIQLQVGDGNAEAARTILAESKSSDEAAETDAVPSSREQNADRAVRGAVFGLLILPLQLYVFWLLLKVLVSDEPLGPKTHRRAIIAAVINLPIMLGFCLFFGALISALITQPWPR
jgi:putative signal transducing protein